MSVSSGLELLRFPLDLLAEITSWIEASDIYILAFVLGNHQLCSNLSRGGVRAVHFRDDSCRNLDLRPLSNFQSLFCVSFDCPHLKKALLLEHLPPSLQELRIYGLPVHWLDAKADPSWLMKNPRNRLLVQDNRTTFNFKSHFHSLKHLHLHLPGPIGCNSLNTTLLVRYFLPDTLETLTLGGLEDVSPIHWGSAFRSLRIATTCLPVQASFVEDVLADAPGVSFDHLTSITANPIIAKAPSRTIWANVETVGNVSDLEAFIELFPRYGLPPPLSRSPLDKPERPYLVAIQLSSWKVKHNGCESRPLRMPESLRSLDLDTYGLPIVDLALFASPHVTRLDCSVDSATIPLAQYFPNLTTLALSSLNDFDSEASLLALPHRLTSLTLIGKANWHHRFLGSLPRGLKKFDLKLTISLSLPLSRGVITHLPQQLVEFSIRSPIEDSLLEHLPKTVTRLTLGSIIITGAIDIHLSEPHKLTYSGRGVLMPYDGEGDTFRNPLYEAGSVRAKRTSFWFTDQIARIHQQRPNNKMLDSISYTFKNLRLPPHLTSIQVAPLALTHDAFALPIALPNLTSLAPGCPASVELWQAASLPSLTRMELFEQSDFLIEGLLPPQVSQILVKVNGYRVTISPTILPQLRSLELSGLSSSIPWDIFKAFINLEHLKTAWPHNVIDITKVIAPLPRSLTSLELIDHPRLLSLKQVFSHLTNLRRLSLGGEIQGDFENVPSTFEALSCGTAKVSDLESFENDASGLIIENETFNFSAWIILRLKAKYPFIKELGACTGPYLFAATHLTSIIDQLSSQQMITKVVFGKEVKLPPRFGKCLPKTVTNLDVMMASGITNATPYHLPSSITELKINGSTFPTPAYQHLPKALVCLELTSSKFLNRHASALPSSLQNLTLTACGIVSRRALAHLPSGLTCLTFDESFINGVYCGFPPNLRSLNPKGFFQFPHMKLPESLTELGSRRLATEYQHEAFDYLWAEDSGSDSSDDI